LEAGSLAGRGEEKERDGKTEEKLIGIKTLNIYN